MAETLAVVDTLDTIGATANSIPRGTKRVLVYITGGGGIAWTAAQIAGLSAKGVQFVGRIDQSNVEQLFTNLRTLVVDIEPGAATNLTADHVAVRRAQAGLRTTLYTFLANFDALKRSVSTFGASDHVDYLVADWNLDRNGAIGFLGQHPECVGVQYASPTSNPRTLVPGSRLTLAQANVDLSVTRADWPAPVAKKRKLPKPHLPKPRVPKPTAHPKVTAAAVAGALSTALLAVLQSKGVRLTQLDATQREILTLLAAVLAGYLRKAA
jgi:hypothetical protein